MLTLFEQLFLLSIHEEKGAVIGAVVPRLNYGLGGAVLAELALSGRARVGENLKVELVDPTPTGDPLLDKVIANIQKEGHERKVTYWLKGLNQYSKKISKRLIERLVAEGVLYEDEEAGYNWLIPSPLDPEVRASAKYVLKRRLREITLACVDPDIREVALLTLLNCSGLLQIVFMKDESRLARQRIHELTVGNALTSPQSMAVEEICSAVSKLTGTD